MKGGAAGRVSAFVDALRAIPVAGRMSIILDEIQSENQELALKLREELHEEEKMEELIQACFKIHGFFAVDLGQLAMDAKALGIIADYHLRIMLDSFFSIASSAEEVQKKKIRKFITMMALLPEVSKKQLVEMLEERQGEAGRKLQEAFFPPEEMEAAGLQMPASTAAGTGHEVTTTNKKAQSETGYGRHLLDVTKKIDSKHIGGHQVEAAGGLQEAATEPSAQYGLPILDLSEGKVRNKSRLGKDHFGSVFKAEVKMEDKWREVALKELHGARLSQTGCMQFRDEMTILGKVRHQNILQAFGISLGQPAILALEFCNRESTVNFLRREDSKDRIGRKQLVEICLGILDACVYLEQQRIVHRGITARNTLVQELSPGHFLPKLTHFSLAKDLGSDNCFKYRMGDVKALKVSWAHTPPEGFPSRSFPVSTYTHKSDVWSFGVFVWEVFSWCRMVPFAKCLAADGGDFDIACHQFDHRARITHIITVRHESLLETDFAPCYGVFNEGIRKILSECWRQDPEQRPSFPILKETMTKPEFLAQFNDAPCCPVNVHKH